MDDAVNSISTFMLRYFGERERRYREWLREISSFHEAVYSHEHLISLYTTWAEDSVFSDAHPPSIKHIEVAQNTAVVIAVEPELGRQKEVRYLLRHTDMGWRIARKGERCCFCIDREKDEPDNCNDCQGTGWHCDEEAAC